MLAITLVENEFGDWEGLYVDNELVVDGHKLSIKDVLYSLESRGIVLEEIELEDDDLNELGYSLPTELSKIKEIID